jgi:hypothetical protein
MILGLFVVQTKIIWPNGAHLKECADILREVESDTGPDQTADQYHNTWKMSLKYDIFPFLELQNIKQAKSADSLIKAIRDRSA